MLIQRSWIQTETLKDTSDWLEIWDAGSKRYERWPDGTERCLEIVSVHATGSSDKSNGALIFTEILRELPLWDAPATITWTERIPVFTTEGSNEYHIPGWTVRVVIVPEKKDVSTIHRHESPVPQQNPRQPLNSTNQNMNRRHYNHKKPHMGSGKRQQPQAQV